MFNSALPFIKMHGAGNDFVVFDNRKLQLSEEDIASLAPDICDRKFGVGSDGILALSIPQKPEADYTMIYRNPDGSNAGMCGNGARCIALFAYSLGFDATHTFNVHNQVYQAKIISEDTVSISFPMEASISEQQINERRLYQIHTGTEHIVTTVEEADLKKSDLLKKQGKKLRYHEHFQPKGTNVNFICGTNSKSLELQTYERGVEDLTLACGTGAIASALAWHHIQKQHQPNAKYQVKTEGGTLNIHFSFDRNTNTYSNIKLEGPAHFVFKGTFL
ncbi:diaminopimelate epimerase [Fodinibius halophilus]|uniref:Diaminopimelate epimerase n=1 Tax=Fodinibius halophilus TaxID=1736908 RepID=A0A6M1SYS7_9BACT|nr:diaminopimelate epimerase [Fodinibius halophilus]NGP86769.1 diaminopimelate epimerase [Fodinibius halophilus]